MTEIKIETFKEIVNLKELGSFKKMIFKDLQYQRIQIIDDPVIAFFNDSENHLIRILNDGRIIIMYCFLDTVQPGIYSYKSTLNFGLL